MFRFLTTFIPLWCWASPRLCIGSLPIKPKPTHTRPRPKPHPIACLLCLVGLVLHGFIKSLVLWKYYHIGMSSCCDLLVDVYNFKELVEQKKSFVYFITYVVEFHRNLHQLIATIFSTLSTILLCICDMFVDILYISVSMC